MKEVVLSDKVDELVEQVHLGLDLGGYTHVLEGVDEQGRYNGVRHAEIVLERPSEMFEKSHGYSIGEYFRLAHKHYHKKGGVVGPVQEIILYGERK